MVVGSCSNGDAEAEDDAGELHFQLAHLAVLGLVAALHCGAPPPMHVHVGVQV